MFDNYPKIRPELPEEFVRIYKSQYKKNREGATTASSLSQKLEAWMHKKVAADVRNNPQASTLEIGAGTLNHLSHENTIRYDIVEPFKELFEDSPLLNRIQNVYSDISEIATHPLYDRIITIATFEHVLNLPEVVAKSALLLKPGGNLRVAIPNEGTFVWTLGWRLTTGLEFKIKHGLDYGILMKHEHVNTAEEIEQVLHYFFSDMKCNYFGLSKKIALYRFYECKNPIETVAEKFLNS